MSSDIKAQNSMSIHILPTSANLLGLCFLLLTSVKLFGFQSKAFFNEALGVAILFFLGASFFSYASIRSTKRAEQYERIADGIFLAGLSFLSIIAFILVANII